MFGLVLAVFVAAASRKLVRRHQRAAQEADRSGYWLDAQGHFVRRCHEECGLEARRERRIRTAAAMEARDPGHDRRRRAAWRDANREWANTLHSEQYHVREAWRAQEAGDSDGCVRHMEEAERLRGVLGQLREQGYPRPVVAS